MCLQLWSFNPHVILRLLQVPRQHVDRLPAARAHDGRGVEPAGQQVLRGADPHEVAAEGVDLGRGQASASCGFLDQPLHGGRAEVPVDGLALVDGAEKPRDVGTAEIEPGPEELCGLPRGEGDPAVAELVGLAPADEHPERAVRAVLDIFGPEGHQFGPPGEELIAEGQHGAVAQAERGVWLGLEEAVEVGAGETLGLSRAHRFAPTNAAEGEVDLLVMGGVRQAQQAVHLADRVEPPPHGRGRLGDPLILKEPADGAHLGREGQEATGRAPRLEGLVFLAKNRRPRRLPRSCLAILDQLLLPPLHDRLRVRRENDSLDHFLTLFTPERPVQFRGRSLGSLYRCSYGVRGRGAAMMYLSLKASFHSFKWIAPSNRNVKHEGTLTQLEAITYHYHHRKLSQCSKSQLDN